MSCAKFVFCGFVQLSEAPSGSGDTSELNGLIEAATGSPIYVTSAAELSGSQVALHPSVSGVSVGEDGGRGDLSPRQRPSHPSSPSTGTTTTAATGNNVNSANVNSSSVNNNISIQSNKSPLRTNGHRNKPSPLSEHSPLHLLQTSASSNINDTYNSSGQVVVQTATTGGSKLCITGTTDVPNVHQYNSTTADEGNISSNLSNLPAKLPVNAESVK